MKQRPLERDYVLQVRTYSQTHDKLTELTELQSKRLGTKLTQGQVLEMLLSDALCKEHKLVSNV